MEYVLNYDTVWPVETIKNTTKSTFLSTSWGSASSGSFGNQYHVLRLICKILSDSSAPVTIRGTKDGWDWICYSVVNTAVNNKSIECMLQASEPPWFHVQMSTDLGLWETGKLLRYLIDRMIDVVRRWWLGCEDELLCQLWLEVRRMLVLFKMCFRSEVAQFWFVIINECYELTKMNAGVCVSKGK